jgi:predicted ATP-dependent protease
LTGKQCVIIPRQNIKDLMLRKEIIEDIKNGLFSIYAMDKIEDATELVFGIKAGELDENGKYPKDSLFGLVVKKLNEFRKTKNPKRKKTKKTTENSEVKPLNNQTL